MTDLHAKDDKVEVSRKALQVMLDHAAFPANARDTGADVDMTIAMVHFGHVLGKYDDTTPEAAKEIE